MLQTNHFCFLKFNSIGIICMSAGIGRSERCLDGMSFLTNVSNPPLVEEISIRYGDLKFVRLNWAEGKELSILVSAIVKTSTKSPTNILNASNLYLMELMLI